MNHKRNIIIIFVLGILITAFGFIVDSDPAYANVWHSVFEFIILSSIVSSLLAVPYVIFWGIKSLLSRKA